MVLDYFDEDLRQLLMRVRDSWLTNATEEELEFALIEMILLFFLLNAISEVKYRIIDYSTFDERTQRLRGKWKWRSEVYLTEHELVMFDGETKAQALQIALRTFPVHVRLRVLNFPFKAWVADPEDHNLGDYL